MLTIQQIKLLTREAVGESPVWKGVAKQFWVLKMTGGIVERAGVKDTDDGCTTVFCTFYPHPYTYKFTCTCTYMYTYTYTLHIYVYVHVYVYAHIYVYRHVHTYPYPYVIRTFYPRSFYYTPVTFNPPKRFATPFSHGGGGIFPQLRELTI